MLNEGNETDSTGLVLFSNTLYSQKTFLKCSLTARVILTFVSFVFLTLIFAQIRTSLMAPCSLCNANVVPAGPTPCSHLAPVNSQHSSQLTSTF